MLNALLFNSSARMYNLRILLLITIALIPTTLVSLPKANSDTWLAFYDRYVMGISIASSCLILPHHIFRLYLSKLMAILDVCLTLVEICMMAYLAGFSIENHMWGSGSTFLSFTLVARPIQLASLLASAIWSTATIMSSPQKITHQYFEFLGGCSQPHGPYTPLRILTNRSVSKPLVRGEFRAIVIIRGIVLSILCIALATLGLYTILFIPLNAQAFTRQVLTNVVPLLEESVNIGPNLGIIVCGQFGDVDGKDGAGRSFLDVKVNGTNCPELTFINTTRGCGKLPTDYLQDAFVSSLWSCSFPWQDIRTIDITIHHDTSSIYIPMMYVQLGQGDFNDISRYTEMVGLMPNAHLFATLTWTQQQLTTSAFALGGLTPPKKILISEFNTVQGDTRYGSNTTWNSSFPIPDSTLSIFQTQSNPVKFVQQYTETSPLDGLATMGGFWTFVNGAFAMFFGANVLYFLFGRRPLSALGIVHIFQRKALIRQWREDFPALHSEGGRPGSENAGIVAFLRERLVNLHDDYIHQDDLEAQKSSTSEEYTTLRTAEREMDEDDTVDNNASVHSDETYSTVNTKRMGGYRIDKDAMSTEE